MDTANTMTMARRLRGMRNNDIFRHYLASDELAPTEGCTYCGNRDVSLDPAGGLWKYAGQKLDRVTVEKTDFGVTTEHEKTAYVIDPFDGKFCSKKCLRAHYQPLRKQRGWLWKALWGLFTSLVAFTMFR